MRKENGTLTKELDQYDSINGQIIKKFDKEENLLKQIEEDIKNAKKLWETKSF